MGGREVQREWLLADFVLCVKLDMTDTFLFEWEFWFIAWLFVSFVMS